MERVGWLDRLKSGCEAKGYALEVALMRVAWLHLGDLASDEISPCAWRLRGSSRHSVINQGIL